MEVTPAQPKPTSDAPTKQLTPTEWADAALAVIGEGGLAAVAVEPLARRLGVTKGSFYWHFANRAALIDAALQRWERLHTEAVIRLMEGETDPADRLRRLLRTVVGVSADDQIEIAMLASADEPAVAAVMARVTERRIAYVAELYEEIGLDAADARRRAVVAVSVYVGHLQLARAAPGSLPDRAAWQQHVDQLAELLLP